MTIEEMRSRKQELGYSYQDIAELAGLPLSTVQKILGGVTVSPRRESILKLEAALAPEPIPPAKTIEGISYYNRRPSDENLMREAVSFYGTTAGKQLPKKQGEYILNDYYALPDDERLWHAKCREKGMTHKRQAAVCCLPLMLREFFSVRIRCCSNGRSLPVSGSWRSLHTPDVLLR